jgi:hypothetical protein
MGNIFGKPATDSVIVLFSAFAAISVLFPICAFPSPLQGCLSANSFFSSKYIKLVEVSSGKYRLAFQESNESKFRVFYTQRSDGASVEVWKRGAVFEFKFQKVFLPESDQVYLGNESTINVQQVFMNGDDAIQLNFVFSRSGIDHNGALLDIEISKSVSTCK